jgi:hypothetical protein
MQAAPSENARANIDHEARPPKCNNQLQYDSVTLSSVFSGSWGLTTDQRTDGITRKCKLHLSQRGRYLPAAVPASASLCFGSLEPHRYRSDERPSDHEDNDRRKSKIESLLLLLLDLSLSLSTIPLLPPRYTSLPTF